MLTIKELSNYKKIIKASRAFVDSIDLIPLPPLSYINLMYKKLEDVYVTESANIIFDDDMPLKNVNQLAEQCCSTDDIFVLSTVYKIREDIEKADEALITAILNHVKI